jgi:hypothetical protein
VTIYQMQTSEPNLPGSPPHQSLRRPLTSAESALAEAMVAIFATGQREFTAVAEQLAARNVARPSGSTEPWSVASLEEELRCVNASLDAAYAAGP